MNVIVDDAIDLAYAFAIDSRVRLVDPKRVVLALSGTPQKEVSKRPVAAATLSNVLTLLQQQAVTVGRNGVFIVALATHAFSSEGVPYTYLIANLFRKPTRQIVALAESPSRLLIFAGDGKVLSTYEHPGPLQHLVVGAQTARYAPKIIVAGANDVVHSDLHADGPVASVLLFDPKNVRSGSQLWYGVIQSPGQTIRRLELVDHDNDARRDIAVSTSTGGTFYLDFGGRIIAIEAATERPAQFSLISPR